MGLNFPNLLSTVKSQPYSTLSGPPSSDAGRFEANLTASAGPVRVSTGKIWQKIRSSEFHSYFYIDF
jgi:hypothetical protein